MKKKLILHAGTHKTGSTSLQCCFAENRVRLLEQGILYPEAGQMYFGHHGLVQRLGSFSAAEYDEWRRIEESEADVLLSSENFSVCPRAKLDALADLFVSREIEVVVVVRSPLAFLYSFWQEEVKHGDQISFPELCYDAFSDPLENEPINVALKLDRLSAAFGRDRLLLVSYDNLAHLKLDLIQYFVGELLGVSTDGFQILVENLNPSLGIHAVEFVRLMNLVHRERGEPRSHRLRDATLEYLSATPESAERILEVSRRATRVARQSESWWVPSSMVRILSDRYGDRFLNKLPDGSIFPSGVEVERRFVAFEDAFARGLSWATAEGAYTRIRSSMRPE